MIKGKVVVVVGGYPKGIDRVELYRMKKGVDYDTPSQYASEHGAVGIIVVPSPYALEHWDRDARHVSVTGATKVVDFQKIAIQPVDPRGCLSFEDERTSVAVACRRAGQAVEQIPEIESCSSRNNR